MFLEENNVYFGTGSDTPNVIDPYTQERRLAVLKDIENVCKGVDLLGEKQKQDSKMKVRLGKSCG